MIARCAVIVLIGALSCASGCIATETGNPTFRPTSSTSPSDMDGLLLADSPMLPSAPMAALEGGPGSIDPPTGEVWVWNLDRELPPAKTPVAADGSFRLTFEAASREHLRMHVVDDQGVLTSLPLDLRVSEEGLIVDEPVSPCVDITPMVLPVDTALTSGTVEISNECATAISRGAARLQSPAVYSVDDPGGELAPGHDATLRIEVLSPGEPAIVLIPLSTPAEGIRAVSVFQF